MKPSILFRHVPATCLAAALAACSSSPSPTASPARDTFDARHAFVVEVPEGSGVVRAWFAMPAEDDPAQTISDWRVEAPYATRIVTDDHGNHFLFLEADRPPAGSIAVTTTFRIVRDEVRRPVDPALTRPHTELELAELSEYLEPSSQSVIDEDVRRMARAAVGDDRNPVSAARKLYDAVLDHVDYHVKDPKPDVLKTMNASGTGSSRHTYTQCTGNCTDFHSLYAALARSQEIPTRVVYGSFFKGPLDGKDVDQSYHCWIEFHAPGIGWIPLDVAVADIFVEDFHANEYSRPRADLTVADGYHGPDPDLVEYYFGNIDARRVVWHRGRDLVMIDPRQAGPPLLWNPKAYVEIDGAPGKVSRKLTFTQVK